jgi:hypothetical protein
VKEFRFFALEGVADELQRPSHKEKCQRVGPQSVNKESRDEQSDRNHYRRYPQRVAHPVYRVLMAARVLRDPLFVGARFVAATAQHSDLDDTPLEPKSDGPNARLRGLVEPC